MEIPTLVEVLRIASTNDLSPRQLEPDVHSEDCCEIIDLPVPTYLKHIDFWCRKLLLEQLKYDTESPTVDELVSLEEKALKYLEIDRLATALLSIRHNILEYEINKSLGNKYDSIIIIDGWRFAGVKLPILKLVGIRQELEPQDNSSSVETFSSVH